MSTITTDIAKAAAQLRLGECAAIPTETVYGLAALASNPAAIAKVFALKQRPLTHPLIVHVAANYDVSQLATDIPDFAKCLMERFWPGPLTLVLPRKPGKVLDMVTANQETVALRCPAHPIAQAVLEAVGEPLVAPSANPFGKTSPTTAKHVQESFKDVPLLILDGGRCQVGIESTIVSALSPDNYQILRPGVIDEDLIRQVISERVTKGISEAIRVSGQLKDHYQPHKPLRCFETFDALTLAYKQVSFPVYVLSFTASAWIKPGFLFPQDPKKAAYELYYQLRLADMCEGDEIWVELPPKLAIWQGIRDRLLKAARKE